MNSISFWTPVNFGACDRNCLDSALEFVDDYFYLGGEIAVVQSSNGGYTNVTTIPGEVNWAATALKVVTYFTGIIPLILLAAKVVLRCAYEFQVVGNQNIGDEEGNERRIIAPSQVVTLEHASKGGNDNPAIQIYLNKFLRNLFGMDAQRIHLDPTCHALLDPTCHAPTIARRELMPQVEKKVIISTDMHSDESFIEAVLGGQWEKAGELLEAMDKRAITILSDRGEWFRCAFTGDYEFEGSEFAKLDAGMQKEIRQVAIKCENNQLVTKLNRLMGKKDESLS